MKARITITLKNGVLDPQGKAIEQALGHMALEGFNNVRQGKYIEMDVLETDRTRAQERVETICRQLLTNSVIENYTIELDETTA